MCATYSTGSNTDDPTQGTTTFTAKAADGDSDTDVNATWSSQTRTLTPGQTSPKISRSSVTRASEASERDQSASHPTVNRPITITPDIVETDWQRTLRDVLFDNQEEMGVVIPGAFFESVSGKAVDTDGEIIEDADWIIAQGPFSVAAKCTNGFFTIKLLRIIYNEFFLVVNSPEKKLNYTIYTAETISAPPGQRNDIEVVFEKAQPGSPFDMSPGIR